MPRWRPSERGARSADGLKTSFFEVTAAAAFLAFAAPPPMPCILEVGLGGRLDATNVVARPLVTAIASLALDHQAYLGDTLVGIAARKSRHRQARRAAGDAILSARRHAAHRRGRGPGRRLADPARNSLGDPRRGRRTPLSRCAGRARPARAAFARDSPMAQRRARRRHAAPSIDARRVANRAGEER